MRVSGFFRAGRFPPAGERKMAEAGFQPPALVQVALEFADGLEPEKLQRLTGKLIADYAGTITRNVLGATVTSTGV